MLLFDYVFTAFILDIASVPFRFEFEKDKRSRKSTLLLIAIVAFVLIVAIIAVYNYYLFSSSYHHTTNARYAGVDKFGIKEIYPTKSNGDEWYMNMSDIVHDPRTSFTPSKPIITKINCLFIHVRHCSTS